ncbi:hypothetical protein [Peribacillus loiseleuriae]|nr:hypothetical protein [Peribacillus loiseleuriae]
MFKIVKSSRQQKEFEDTWEYFCDMYGWYNDPYAKSGIRYNLLLPNKQKKVIGTIEFIPYDPTNPDSTVEGRFPFSFDEEIAVNQNRIWEIDKLCLHKDYHRQGYFENFMHVFYDHAKRHSPKYYIALIEKRFFRMLRISFGLGVEQKGEALIGSSTALIPVVFDVEKIMQDDENVRRLLEAKWAPDEYNAQFPAKVPLLKMNLTSNICRKLFGR